CVEIAGRGEDLRAPRSGRIAHGRSAGDQATEALARGADLRTDREAEERADLDRHRVTLRLEDLAVHRVQRLGGADLHARSGAVAVARIGAERWVEQPLGQAT